MMYGKRLIATTTLVLGCVMSSACGQPEHPRTVSDFCLVDKRISVEVEPAPGTETEANQFDTEQTVNEVLSHNEVHDRLCLGVTP